MNNQSTRGNRTSRLRESAKAFVWSSAILAILAVLIWVALDVVSGIKLRRAIAGWQEAGLTMNLNDFLPAEVPQMENTAVVLNRVVEIPPPDVRDLKLRDPRWREGQEKAIALAEEVQEQLLEEAVSSETVEELAQTLADPTLAYRLATVREAVELERFDAYHDYDEGLNMLLPYVGELRDLGRLLHAEGILAAAQDRWADTYEALAVRLRLGSLLYDDPTLISQLTRGAMHAAAARDLEILLHTQPPDEATARRLEELIANLPEGAMLNALQVNDVILGRWLLERLEKGEFFFRIGITEAYAEYLEKGIFRPLHKADMAVYLETSRKRLDKARENWGPVFDGGEFRQWEAGLINELPWYAIITGELPISTGGVFLRDRVNAAEMALARAALAANAYRLTRNEWPSSLEDLVPQYFPEAPQDPFSGEALQYRFDDDRVILYSLGPNMENNGGQPIERRPWRMHHDEPGDLVWVLESTTVF